MLEDIIKTLLENGPLTYQELASKLNTSVDIIKHLVVPLKREGIFKINLKLGDFAYKRILYHDSQEIELGLKIGFYIKQGNNTIRGYYNSITFVLKSLGLPQASYVVARLHYPAIQHNLNEKMCWREFRHLTEAYFPSSLLELNYVLLEQKKNALSRNVLSWSWTSKGMYVQAMVEENLRQMNAKHLPDEIFKTDYAPAYEELAKILGWSEKFTQEYQNHANESRQPLRVLVINRGRQRLFKF